MARAFRFFLFYAQVPQIMKKDVQAVTACTSLMFPLDYAVISRLLKVK